MKFFQYGCKPLGSESFVTEGYQLQRRHSGQSKQSYVPPHKRMVGQTPVSDSASSSGLSGRFLKMSFKDVCVFRQMIQGYGCLGSHNSCDPMVTKYATSLCLSFKAICSAYLCEICGCVKW